MGWTKRAGREERDGKGGGLRREEGEKTAGSQGAGMLGRRRVGAGELHCPLLLCASGKVANEAIVFAQWLCFGFVFFPSV